MYTGYGKYAVLPNPHRACVPNSRADEASALPPPPPLTKNTSPLTLFPHLARAAEAKETASPKGLLTGDPIAPLTWDQINAASADKSGLNANGTTVTTEAATSGTTASEAPSTSTQDAPFDVDTFMNATNGNTAAQPATLPAAAPAPSSVRTLRGQTEKSFNAKTGKAKAKGTANALDGTPSFFSDADLITYNHIGIAPPTDEGAQKNRARTDQNEVKVTNYIIALERGINNNRNDANSHFAEIAKIMGEIKASITQPTPVADDPAFIEVYTAVADNRKGIQGIINMIPSAETFQVLASLPAEIAALRASINGLQTGVTMSSSAPLIDVVPPTAMPVHAGTAIASMGTAVGLECPSFAPLTFANNIEMPPPAAFTPLSVPLNTDGGNLGYHNSSSTSRPAKRTRKDNDSGFASNGFAGNDVVY